MEKFNFFISSIDWLSVKLAGVSIIGGVMVGGVAAWLAGIAAISTIIYNGIRIYKELKRKK